MDNSKTMKVMELLEELEDMIDAAKNMPLTNKVMVDAGDIFNIVREIRLALPNDVQQAKWIKDERDNIIRDAKDEYEKVIREAKKQADYLVENDDITLRAKNLAKDIEAEAQTKARMTMLKAYDYVDKILYDMEEKMNFFSVKIFNEMYGDMEKKIDEICGTLAQNRQEIKSLAIKTRGVEGGGEYSDDYDDEY